MSKIGGPKIVMVGGGSFNWTPWLLSDLLYEKDLADSQVVLLDPDLKSARTVADIVRHFAKARGAEIDLTCTANSESAFRGCDFAIVTISTGGLATMAHDLAIPEQYGIFATVGDTAGPGGWCRALRNIPVMVEMAQQIERLSPRAVILNYTNPLAVLTAAIDRTCRLRNVGLCHGLFETYAVLQLLLDAAEKDLAVRSGGVNHFFWIWDFAVKGQAGYPMLAKLLDGQTIDELIQAKNRDPKRFHSTHRLFDELYREYGCLTYSGDRHTCEFLPGMISPTQQRLAEYGIHRTSHDDRVRKRLNNLDYARQMVAGKMKMSPRSRETAVDMVLAISKNRPFVDVVNRPNVGQIENLPRGVVVETLGVVDALGFRPITQGSMPVMLAGLVEPHCRVQQMTLEAAMKGDRKLAVEALMLDPQCWHLRPAAVRKMAGELMEATADYLPQFKKARRRD